MANQLYYGDNLHILREHIPDESVDLIYLDPPFNSQATYNVQFYEPPGERSQAQLEACADNTPRATLLENPTNITLSGQNGLIINGSASPRKQEHIPSHLVVPV
jgi:site-specific DNA-methyltransferase (adenine-specific)